VPGGIKVIRTMNTNSNAPLPPKPARDDARPAVPGHDGEWRAGDLPCGILILELQDRIGDLEPGQVLKLETNDPGARTDIPSWCTLTENRLLKGEHPLYWIRKKG